MQVVPTLKQGLEEGDVLFCAGVEAPVGFVVVLDPAGAQVQERLCRSRIIGHGHSREVLMIGRASDLREARQAGNALGHGEPPDDAFAVSCALTADKKTIGVIDDGLNAQDASELVVHFDPVASDAMLDAHAFDPRLEVFDDVGLEVAGQLLAQEAEHIPSAEAQECVLDQFTIQGLQLLSATEEDVGGELGLVYSPVVSLVFENGAEQRVDLQAQRAKEQGPVLMGELIGQSLCFVRTGDVDESVVDLLELKATALHTAGKPLVAVDRYLYDEWKPALQPHMNEAQIGMQEIIIQTEAFAPSELNPGAVFAVGDLESRAHFQRGEYAHQPFADAVTVGNATGFVVLADVTRQVLVRTASRSSRVFGMLHKPVGMALHKPFEVLDQQPVSSHQFLHPLCIADCPEVPLENDSVKALKISRDFPCEFLYKYFHGVLPECACKAHLIYGMDASLLIENRPSQIENWVAGVSPP